jgi:hypothetical protein
MKQNPLGNLTMNENLPNPPHTSTADLVTELLAAEGWPAPQLLRDILARGEAAIEPLRDALRTDEDGIDGIEAVRVIHQSSRPDVSLIPRLVVTSEQTAKFVLKALPVVMGFLIGNIGANRGQI